MTETWNTRKRSSRCVQGKDETKQYILKFVFKSVSMCIWVCFIRSTVLINCHCFLSWKMLHETSRTRCAEMPVCLFVCFRWGLVIFKGYTSPSKIYTYGTKVKLLIPTDINKLLKKTQIISQGFVFPLWYFLLWHLLAKLRAFHFSTDACGQTLRAGFPGWDPQP